MSILVSPDKKAFWRYEPGALAEPPDRATMLRVFAMKECQRHIELFERHANPVHLWKAWRCARACGPMPAAIMERFIPYIDKLAAVGVKPSTPKRATQHEDSDWILRDYQYEKDVRDAMRSDPETKGTALSLTDIHKRVAARHKTTSGRVEQLILQHEGRDGRSRTGKSHKRNG